ncbi:MAG TPA: glycosyltransferase family 39 protein [Solirubrobacteraceae bacterium]
MAEPRRAPDTGRALRILLAITLLGGALRFATLDVQSIWLDESATMILVRRGLGGMLSHLSSSESAPPLYYVLVWAWTKVFGAGALGFRSLSALVGTLTIPVMYLAGKRVSPRAGLWAAALTAVNPAMYYYSQEARAYGLLVFFAACAFVLWQRALDEPSARNLAWWSAASALALLTHYFAVFLFIPEAVLLIRRIGFRRCRVAIGAVVLVGIALAPLALAQRSDGKAGWIEAESLSSRIAQSVKQFAVGLSAPLQIVAAPLIVLLAASVVLLLWRRGRERERSAARDAAIVAAVALLIPLVLAAPHAIDVYDGRNVVATWVALAVLIAAGIGVGGTHEHERWRGRWLGTLAGAGIVAISLAVVVAINVLSQYQRDDWRGAARAIGSVGPDRVLVSSEFASAPLSIYLGPLSNPGRGTLHASEVDFVSLRVRRSTSAPLPAPVPASAPPGFRLLGVKRSSSYAVARYVPTGGSGPASVSVAALRHVEGEAGADVMAAR